MIRPAIAALVLGLMAGPAISLEEWPTYGHDYGDSRYSPLAQITPANVSGLKPAWTYHMRPPGREARGFAANLSSEPCRCQAHRRHVGAAAAHAGEHIKRQQSGKSP